MCRPRRPRCCRLMLPAPHPLAAQPSPSARPHNPKPASDPACARDHLARTHPAGPRCGRPFVPFAPSPAPARELRTRRCRPEFIRAPRCAVWSPGRRGGGAGGAGAGGPAATREARRVVGGSLARPLASLGALAFSTRLPALPRNPRSLRLPPAPLSPLAPQPARSARPRTNSLRSSAPTCSARPTPLAPPAPSPTRYARSTRRSLPPSSPYV